MCVCTLWSILNLFASLWRWCLSDSKEFFSSTSSYIENRNQKRFEKQLFVENLCTEKKKGRSGNVCEMSRDVHWYKIVALSDGKQLFKHWISLFVWDCQGISEKERWNIKNHFHVWHLWKVEKQENCQRNVKLVGRWTEMTYRRICRDKFPVTHFYCLITRFSSRITSYDVVKRTDHKVPNMQHCNPRFVVELIVQLLFALAWKLLHSQLSSHFLPFSWHLANDSQHTPQSSFLLSPPHFRP